jgi:rhodanese-related sulfurtransferase
MVRSISPDALNTLLAGRTPFAFIDVREAGEYNSSHIPGASLLPRRQLEFQMSLAVPNLDTPIVVCDDDGRRAALSVTTLERMGYSQLCILEGGMNHWVTQNYPTEWGSNVPSKDFGEQVEVVHHVPEIDATELHARLEKGEKCVILDTRTPEEYRRFCVPGGRSLPGGELGLRIHDVIKDVEPGTTIVVNCAGRTRSIIGTRMLQRLNVANVVGLKNGTSGWMLAGYELEVGADRVTLPEPSPQGLAAAEAHADRLAAEDGVRLLDITALQTMLQRRNQETVYLIDVRTEEEFTHGHIPGFRWFPGGQAVQRSDDVAVVKNCPIIFCCDRKARATFTASWYRQMGFVDVYAVDGGTTAWKTHGLALASGRVEPPPFGLQAARGVVQLLKPQALRAAMPPVVIYVESSQDFARAHVPGSHWVPRGWLELRIGSLVPAYATPIAVTCTDGRNAALAGATLKELGYENALVLDGGMAAWQAAGLAVEKGLTNVMAPPMDVVVSGPDRTFADMIHYLRWETALGEKYTTS